MSWKHRLPAAALAATVLLTLPACTTPVDTPSPAATSAAPGPAETAPPPAATAATDAPAGSEVDALVGQEYRVDQSDYEDPDFFVMQPSGTLTWFSYIIGGHRYEQHDDATWSADGDQVTFTFPQGAKMTGTLDGNTLTGRETNEDGTKYTWTAKPGTRPEPVP